VADRLARAIDDAEAAFGPDRWPAVVLSNHDQPRHATRLSRGRSRDRDAIARAAAVLLLTMRGTPFLYYGEEIAMRTDPPRSIDEVRDPVGRRFWPAYKGRDGVRRPMQWSRAPGAGFTRGTPWLPLSGDSGARNVEAQDADQASILGFYRSLLRLRRANPALASGVYEGLDPGPGILAYARTTGGQRVVVVLNFTSEVREIAGLPVDGSAATVLLGTHRSARDRVSVQPLRLRPLESVILQG
jgi:alpha-glucosidase